MKLKKYQIRTLKKLEDFLTDAKIVSNERAFEKNQEAQGYNPNYQSLRNLEDVPLHLLTKIPCQNYQNYFSLDETGRYGSFANLISYLRPLMIVDEAHNYSTDLSFDVTKTLRPSAVIELTATPAANSNVLIKVTAQELYSEEMIKLPIIVGEVSDSPYKILPFKDVQKWKKSL